MKIFGMNIKPDEITSVTIRRNGADVTISSAGETSPKIAGFAIRPPKPKAPGIELLRENQRPPKR